jgi:O-antigen ligase
MVFLYIASGRLTDYVLADLHVPFIVSIVALVVAVVNRSLLNGFTNKIGLMIIGFTVWMVLAIPTSVWLGGSVELLKETWSKSLAAFIVTAALIFSSKQTIRAIHVLAWGFLTAALLGFPFGVEKDGRFNLSQGGYTGANEYASAMVQGVICWMFIVQDRSKAIWWRVLGLVPIIPILFIMSKTGSRAAFLSLLVALVGLFWRQTARGKVIFLILAASGFLVAASLMSNITKHRLFTFFNPSVTEEMTTEEEGHMSSAVESTQGRLHLLYRSLEFTVKHPVFGVGPGLFAVAEDDLSKSEGKKKGNWQGTHNTYTQISSEMGLPGLAFYVSCMVFCWKELRRIRKRVSQLTGQHKEQWLLTVFTLQLLLVQFSVFFCFAHLAYEHVFPLLAAIILAFVNAADRELPKERKKNPLPVAGRVPASA